MLNPENIFLKKHDDFRHTEIHLPASKSIANRALIVNALANSSKPIINLSEARDTQTMIKLLGSQASVLDVLDAGTTMRFLTAFLSITNRQVTLTGSERMQQRPIKILVEALQQLGGQISYTNNEGYPPLKIDGFSYSGINKIAIKGDVSSQYISALLMIAPLLPEGLTLELVGKVGSKPYIEMTLEVMKSFGIKNYSFDGREVKIPHQSYLENDYRVEPDWSAASYWYSLVALSNSSSILLKDLSDFSIQGDHVIHEIMVSLGVRTTFTAKGALLEKCPHQQDITINFTDCPDLAQTVAVVCAAKGITGNFTGLESLRIKETDRIAALQNELKKIGAKLVEKDSNWTLIPAPELEWTQIKVSTYEDHRMAMAFAPLCLIGNIEIEEKSVVNKSYPSYWKDYELVGLLN